MLGAINTYLSSATPTQRVIVSIWLNLPFLFVFSLFFIIENHIFCLFSSLVWLPAC